MKKLVIGSWKDSNESDWIFEDLWIWTTLYEKLSETDVNTNNVELPKTFDENSKKRLTSTCKFSNHDISNFILLLRKGVYLYEYMDDWEISNEISLPEKGDFKINLNMEDVTDADYRHAKTFVKILK